MLAINKRRAQSIAERGAMSRLRTRRSALLCACASLVLRWPLTARAEPTEAPELQSTIGVPQSGLIPKTLEQCVTTALTQNLDVRLSAEDKAIAGAQKTGAAWQFGPSVHVDGTYQHWTRPYITLGIPIHEQDVWNVTATITQPITQLFAIYESYKVKDLGVDIAQIRHEALRRQTALSVVQQYYQLLQAERLRDVAQVSIEQLSAQERLAQSLHDHGTVSRDDVLRAHLAVANAQQRRIAADSRVTVQRMRLAMLMGLPPDTGIEAVAVPEERLPTAGVPDMPELAKAQQTAEMQRVELREMDKQLALARSDKNVAYSDLAPKVSLVGSYIHNDGSLLSQLNAGYVGAVASWDLWDRGATLSNISQANARSHKAVFARSKVRDQIRLEVTQAFLDERTAAEALQVAQAAVVSAQENYRLVSKRYQAAVATSFDVVDAESLLTQARAQLQTALYDLVIAKASLHAAMGADAHTLARE